MRHRIFIPLFGLSTSVLLSSDEELLLGSCVSNSDSTTDGNPKLCNQHWGNGSLQVCPAQSEYIATRMARSEKMIKVPAR
ncbi:hypothetical protein M758_UG062900 [Ceratodon purpureus]|nr:hypothetical protein M758_UG062900 [Ceratodon purpureus]